MKPYSVPRSGAAALLCCCTAIQALAAEAYVSLGGPGGSVSQYRPSGGAPVRTFATPPGAVDILLSADASRLYVGTTTAPQNNVKGGSPSIVAVLNAADGTPLRRYPMPGNVVKMVRDAGDTHLYASGTAADGAVQVMSLDLATGATAAAPVAGTTPFHLYPIGLSADGASLFMVTPDAIAVFDAATLAPAAAIALPANGIVAPPLATPDGKTLLTAGNGSVYVIDLATRTLAKKIPIVTSAAAFGDALSPDGKTFYVSAGTLSAIDVASRSVKGAVDLKQSNPYRLGLSPDGSTLFATDLTYGTTTVVDAATLSVRRSLRGIAPPYAVAVRPNGHALILNENSNALARVDTSALQASPGFAVGDSPGMGVFAEGKLFVPETANLALQEAPAAPTPAKPISVNLIVADSAAALGAKVYVSQGSLVRVVDAALERATGTILVRVPSQGGIGSAITMAGSGDGRSLLATYAVLAIDGGPIAGGIAKIDTTSGAQRNLSSFPFVPGIVASNRAGTAAYAIGFLNEAQVGAWDTANNVFVKSAVLAGSPSYVALAAGADGSTLYLVDARGKVDILDATSLQRLASVAAGTQPSGIAISADGRHGLVTDRGSNRVSVLDLTTRAVIGTVDVGAPSAAAVFMD
jgi:YVTN family beta-propeller protein